MKKLALIVLDGWGVGKKDNNNAIHVANTPFFDKLWNEYPHTILQASHEYVGLPHGQLGGSEVGHMVMGAGKIIYQDLMRITIALDKPNDSEYGIIQNKTFQQFLDEAKKHKVHLIGMISPGGIHSHQEHLFNLLTLMKEHGCQSPYIHFISDGRDTPPQSGITFAKELSGVLHKLNFGTIATVCGRFYTMDRDLNWDRVEQGADLIAYAKGKKLKDGIHEAFQDNYAEGLTDELQEATVVYKDYEGVQPEDVLFFFNFRSDRMRQIVTKMHELFPHNKLFTMAKYHKDFTYPYVFDKVKADFTIGEILSKQGINQLRAAETDKIPHVTYFFNGGVDVVFPGEEHAFVESTKVTYDKSPQMRAKEIVDEVVKMIEAKDIGFALVNFANADLVGHFGIFESTVKACEILDTQLERLCNFLTDKGYMCIVTSDHGNADYKMDEKTGKPLTSHSLNPVPFIVYDPHNPEIHKLKLDQNTENGLSKVAGTALDLMGIERPQKDFESLIVKE
jgi:2,3-bisphosphoglycerate-independent phosphoglycerate mutase